VGMLVSGLIAGAGENFFLQHPRQRRIAALKKGVEALGWNQ